MIGEFYQDNFIPFFLRFPTMQKMLQQYQVGSCLGISTVRQFDAVPIRKQNDFIYKRGSRPPQL